MRREVLLVIGLGTFGDARVVRAVEKGWEKGRKLELRAEMAVVGVAAGGCRWSWRCGCIVGLN